jgi:hypothetical protein
MEKRPADKRRRTFLLFLSAVKLGCCFPLQALLSAGDP